MALVLSSFFRMLKLQQGILQTAVVKVVTCLSSATVQVLYLYHFECRFILSHLFQGKVSIDRLSNFLNLEELDPNNVEKTMPEHSKSQNRSDCSSITQQNDK